MGTGQMTQLTKQDNLLYPRILGLSRNRGWLKMSDRLLVFCSCPNRDVAGSIAAVLVEQRLAACVTIMPEVASVYRWQGRVEHDNESLLLIKSTSARYAELERTIVEHHPYELPEIVATTLTKGLPDYLNWLDAETRNTP